MNTQVIVPHRAIKHFRNSPKPLRLISMEVQSSWATGTETLGLPSVESYFIVYTETACRFRSKPVIFRFWFTALYSVSAFIVILSTA